MKSRTMIRKCCLTILLALFLAAGIFTGAMAEQSNNFFCADDDAIAGMAACAGKLYVLRYEGLFEYTDGEMKLVSTEISADYRRENSADYLLSDGSSLFAVRLNTGEILQIAENGNICNLQLLGKLPENIESWQFFTQDGRIYWIRKLPNKTDLVSCTLKGEDVSEIPIYNTGSSQIVNAASGTNGHAMILERSRVSGKPTLSLSEMELQTGKITKLCTLENNMRCACYDAETDSVMLSGEGSLFRWSEKNGLERIASTLSGDTISVASTVGGYAVLVDHSIAFRGRESADESRSLRICAQYARSEDYREFFTENPDLAVEFVKTSGKTPEEQFTDDMVNRNGDIDLYLLSDSSFLSTIREKQYFADLSESELITQMVDDMYLPFFHSFSMDGKICAIPQTVYVSMLGYNPDFFEKYGLQVPKSMGELLNLAEDWIDNYAEEYPEALFDPFSNGITLQYILTNDLAEMEANGKPAVLSTPELTQLLEQFKRVRSKFSHLSMSGSFDEYALNVMDIPCRGDNQLMQLSVIDGNKPVICGAGVEMTYIVINPCSANKDAALKFAESIAKSWDPQLQLILMKSKAHAVENPEYAGTISELREKLAEMTSRAENAEDEQHQHEILAAMDKIAQEMEICEMNRWLVSQDDARWYQSVAQSIALPPKDVIALLCESQPGLFAKYESGAMSTEAFLKQLDEKIRMVMWE